MLNDTTDSSSGRGEVARDVLRRRFPHGRIERVLLINPPDGDADLFTLATAKRGRYHNYPPYGLTVLAAHLRRAGVDVRILNLNHELLVAAFGCENEAAFDFDGTWQRLLDRAVAEFVPDLIGVTCMFTMTHTALRKICAYAAATGCPVAIGGVHVTNDVERVLDDIPSASFAFLREADTSLPLFCRVVAGDEPVDALRQVILCDEGRRLRYLEECRPSVEEFDAIPAFDLTEIERLSQFGVIGIFHAFVDASTPTATCLSNRGCRAQCTFCSVPNFNGRLVRQRPVDSVLDELEVLRDTGVKHIVWLDDDLLKDDDRALSLFRGMTQRKLGLTWDATNGLIAASCNQELVAAMVESGCTAVNLGMESGNPTMLTRIRKPGTVSTFLRAAEVFRGFPSIHVRVLLMIGFPGETLGMIEDTLNVALAMNCDWYAITPLQPLPNTPIYDAMVAQGLIAPVGDRLTYYSGGYGKLDKLDEAGGAVVKGFRHAFDGIPHDAVPTPDQIHDIWFYMNYHLNFHRLFHEDRPAKIDLMLRQLATLSDKLSPDNALALYFIGYLQWKRDGAVQPSIVARLGRQLESSAYWRTRFATFGMAADDVARGRFPNEHVPRLTIAARVPDASALQRKAS
jgi:radical SAM superfamily enzyme YgiQ (UPF0313 family)